MASRRNHHGGHGGGRGGHGGAAGAGGNGNEFRGFGIDPETIENYDADVTRCCVPADMINLDVLRDALTLGSTCTGEMFRCLGADGPNLSEIMWPGKILVRKTTPPELVDHPNRNNVQVQENS